MSKSPNNYARLINFENITQKYLSCDTLVVKYSLSNI